MIVFYLKTINLSITTISKVKFLFVEIGSDFLQIFKISLQISALGFGDLN